MDGDAVRAYLQAGNFGGPLVIVRGRPPRAGENGTLEHHFLQKSEEKVSEDEKGRVDFREYSSLNFATSGELLTTRRPPTPGENGADVFGSEIPANPGQAAALSAGPNVTVSEDGARFSAAGPGVVTLQGAVLSVDAVLVHQGDVDFNVGNIDFDGTINIQGAIHEGFTVKATADVVVQSVSKAFVEAGRNVVVERGIIGSPETHVTAKGNVTAKFIENANVHAGGSVIVADIILHANVTAGKHVVVRGGKHASIVGGQIRAAGCIEARAIGAEITVETQVEIGLDPALRARLAEVQKLIDEHRAEFEKNIHAVEALNKLRARMRQIPLDKETQLRQMIAAAQTHGAELKKLLAEQTTLQEQAGAAKPGFVSVREKIYPGTHLIIVDQTLSIDKAQSASRFYLNPTRKGVGSAEFKEVDVS
ncbi:MAG: hypothetical protein A3I06_16250 [Candidatus Lindowbacteria bacterium RIFCSPLOWO2_02_FULL_62_12]|nr:MAG: hypothetical protein A3I06_16250 [Candidatus Lindowbacteria bacterium RIFCSPLOWO2_02_FULL_62_12]